MAQTGRLAMPAKTPPKRPGAKPQSRIKPGKLKPRPGPTIEDLALNVIRAEFTAFLKHETGTRIGKDIEALHQMRVACRRLRAAFRLFERHLPPTIVRSHATLRWMGRSLGRVRDLDVKKQELLRWRDECEPGHRRRFLLILDWLDRNRNQARCVMIRRLDSRRYVLWVQRLTATLSQPTHRLPAPNPPVGEILSELIRPFYRQVLKAGRRVKQSPTPKNYHRLRLRCKRLRYALEFASDRHNQGVAPYLKRLVRLQQVLGDYNDTIVGRANIRAWVDHPAIPLPAAAILLLGALEERLRRHGNSRLRRFPGRFRDFAKRPWRPLARALRTT